MQVDDYVGNDATALAALVRQGEVSAEELLDAALARMSAVDRLINSLSQIFSDQAKASIAAVSQTVRSEVCRFS